jgi:hypothetical protein
MDSSGLLSFCKNFEIVPVFLFRDNVVRELTI